VLKLFHDRFDVGEVEAEAEVVRAVHAAGLPVPLAGDVIQVGERNGLLYERVHGRTMLEVLELKPWRLLRYARQLAALHAQMHARTPPSVFKADVLPQRRRWEKKIRRAAALSARLRSAVLRALDVMPEGDRVCHGDLHPANVLLTADGEPFIIDWADAAPGNPLADVARTSVILLGAAGSDLTASPLMKWFVRLFHTVYRHRYFGLRPGGEDAYRRWLPIAAAARLSENIPEVESWLLARTRMIGTFQRRP